MDAIVQLVPIGEENAVTARLIWQVYGLGAPSSLRMKLNILAARGAIERKLVPKNHTADVSLYFRKPT
ncbi:hypothetical protein [Bradyrhizobium sp. JYMT SZCCT0428]|uniref:hypothetical protein n=1 Tax=Bradyrhizobium sp. JYMT SZCCT0428 TaxID=2807673 RepID=UPI001BA9B4A1|nr:hypothetical protein [Bradyrhizobium sp. JYMT SZCCT0428]MBR1157467.1 hypothetical protein [Bradyrhizobium sp. JYMT SZCCT0428]